MIVSPSQTNIFGWHLILFNAIPTNCRLTQVLIFHKYLVLSSHVMSLSLLGTPYLLSLLIYEKVATLVLYSNFRERERERERERRPSSNVNYTQDDSIQEKREEISHRICPQQLQPSPQCKL